MNQNETLALVAPFAGALACLLGLTACGPRESAPSEDPTAGADEPRDRADTAEDADVHADAPSSAEAIGALLSARHTRDLPGEATLRRHDDAEASLRWLAGHGPRHFVRVRALASLRFFASRPTRELLLGLLADASTHATQRAAAIEGTGAMALESDPELRAAIERHRDHDDARVRGAAAERLAGLPTTPTAAPGPAGATAP